MKKHHRLALAAVLTFPSVAPAEVLMSPLMSFSGDGWLAPGEVSWLSGTTATERSIAYSSAAGHLYVASRTGGNRIRILDPSTGAEVITATEGVNTTGVTGGTFGLSCVSVAADGILYACNLASPLTAATPFRIYRWADIDTPPITVYDTLPPSPAVPPPLPTAGRLGDTFDAIGSGAGTLLAAGESNSTGAGSRNGYVIFTPGAAPSFDATLVTFTGTPVPAAGDFRIGMTFTDSDSIVGSPGSGGLKFTTFAGATGTLDQSRALTNTAERPMDYIVLGGKPLLATLETNGNTASPPATFSTVRVYDLTNPTPLKVAEGRTANSWLTQGSSGPFTGSVQWGKVTGNSATLYALSTNNGIQAFTVTVPVEFTSSSLTAGGVWNLTWTSVPGATYRLEASSDLAGWSTVATGIPADAGPTTSYAWTLPAAFSGRSQVRVFRE